MVLREAGKSLPCAFSEFGKSKCDCWNPEQSFDVVADHAFVVLPCKPSENRNHVLKGTQATLLGFISFTIQKRLHWKLFEKFHVYSMKNGNLVGFVRKLLHIVSGERWLISQILFYREDSIKQVL